MMTLAKRLPLIAATLTTMSALIIALVLTPSAHSERSAPTAGAWADLAPATQSWDALLKQYVHVNGGVDYTGLKSAKAQLSGFIAAHASISPAALARASDRQKKAIYINLYNATMMFNLLRYTDAEAIIIATEKFTTLEINTLKIPGGNIWNGDFKISLAGHQVNLDDIEHQLLRGKAEGKLVPLQVSKLDPRLHAAVNCAALSCPRVRETAYTEANIDALLEENIHEWLSSDVQFKKIDADTMQANSIVFWYYSDFDSYGQEVLKNAGAGDYLSTFIAPTAKDSAWKKQHLKAHFNDRSTISLKLSSAFEFKYDWHVNDRRNKH